MGGVGFRFCDLGLAAFVLIVTIILVTVLFFCGSAVQAQVQKQLMQVVLIDVHDAEPISVSRTGCTGNLDKNSNER